MIELWGMGRRASQCTRDNNNNREQIAVARGSRKACSARLNKRKDFSESPRSCRDSGIRSHTWVQIEDSLAIALPSHARCITHTLALCASADVKYILEAKPELAALHNAVLAKCNQLWKKSRFAKSSEIIKGITGMPLDHITASENNWSIFRDIEAFLRPWISKPLIVCFILTGKNLLRPNATRWNNLYDSFAALIRIKEHAPALAMRLGLWESLTADGFVYLEEYLASSKPIAVALDRLQGDKKAFYGTALPTLYMVKIQLATLDRVTLRFCRPIAIGLAQSIDRRFAEVLNCHTELGEKSAIAASSIPLLKDSWLPCTPRERQEYILRRFKELIADRLASENALDSEPMEIDGYVNFSGAGSSRSSSTPDAAGSIMNQYLRHTSKEGVMLREFPAIEQIFRNYNTAPPSSSGVKRLFNHATMTSAPKSNRISDIKFEQRVMLRKNAAFLAGALRCDVDIHDE